MSEKTDFTKAVDELDRRTDEEARRRFGAGAPARALPAARDSVKGFWNEYFKRNGRREGVPGLFRAVNEGMFHFLSYAKHWELERNAKRGA